jgi:hypothetical protein
MDNIIKTIAFCVFGYAMVSLFFELADYIGRHGL